MTAGEKTTIIAVTGMKAEARILRRAGNVHAICSGGNCRQLTDELEQAISKEVRGILSFGIAGGLAPDVRPGGVIIGESVVTHQERFASDAAWVRALLGCLPHARLGPMAGSDQAVATAAAKSKLFEKTGALAIDMESHAAARVALKHKLPFAILRVVADAADRTLPPAALAGLGPNGTINVQAVMASLARKPAQLPQLMRVTADTNIAMRALLGSFRAVHEALGPRLGI